jgi:hypothetical protein
MGPLVHAERDVSRLGGVVDRVESLLPELFHGLGRHQQVSVRELLSVGSLLDAQRVEGVETVGGRREGARPRRGPLPPGLPFRFTPVALLVRDYRAHHERDVPRRDHHDSLVLEPVVLRRLDDLHLFGGGRFGDGGRRGAGFAPRHRRTQTLRAAAVVVALGVAAQRTLMGDSLPKRRDDLALGRALPDPVLATLGGIFLEIRLDRGDDALGVRTQRETVDVDVFRFLKLPLGVDDFLLGVVRVREAVVRTVRLFGQGLVGGPQEAGSFYDGPVTG